MRPCWPGAIVTLHMSHPPTLSSLPQTRRAYPCRITLRLCGRRVCRAQGFCGILKLVMRRVRHTVQNSSTRRRLVFSAYPNVGDGRCTWIPPGVFSASSKQPYPRPSTTIMAPWHHGTNWIRQARSRSPFDFRLRTSATLARMTASGPGPCMCCPPFKGQRRSASRSGRLRSSAATIYRNL